MNRSGMRQARTIKNSVSRMKRRDLLRHNPSLNKRSAVPSHIEINDHLAKKVCNDLGIPYAIGSGVTIPDEE